MQLVRALLSILFIFFTAYATHANAQEQKTEAAASSPSESNQDIPDEFKKLIEENKTVKSSIPDSSLAEESVKLKNKEEAAALESANTIKANQANTNSLGATSSNSPDMPSIPAQQLPPLTTFQTVLSVIGGSFFLICCLFAAFKIKQKTGESHLNNILTDFGGGSFFTSLIAPIKGIFWLALGLLFGILSAVFFTGIPFR
jgi:hypothetical protein